MPSTNKNKKSMLCEKKQNKNMREREGDSNVCVRERGRERKDIEDIHPIEIAIDKVQCQCNGCKINNAIHIWEQTLETFSANEFNSSDIQK